MDLDRADFDLGLVLPAVDDRIAMSIQGFTADGQAYPQWIQCLGTGEAGESFLLPQLLAWEEETDILIYLGVRHAEEPVLGDGSHLQLFLTHGAVGSATLHR